jgi:hypothetical protein
MVLQGDTQMANTRTKVEFDQESVERYRFANGHKPKGWGAWSFSLGRNGSWTEFHGVGNYTDAKKAARRVALAATRWL